MHDATDNAPIVCTLDASHIRRQMRLNPLPLLIAQPKKVLSHGPDPPKRIKHIWNQDCFATAAKLMSSHSSSALLHYRSAGRTHVRSKTPPIRTENADESLPLVGAIYCGRSVRGASKGARVGHVGVFGLA